jgi:hypothetical protein
MQLQTVLCCTYTIIFIFKIKHKLYIASGLAPPLPLQGAILVARLYWKTLSEMSKYVPVGVSCAFAFTLHC